MNDGIQLAFGKLNISSTSLKVFLRNFQDLFKPVQTD